MKQNMPRVSSEVISRKRSNITDSLPILKLMESKSNNLSDSPNLGQGFRELNNKKGKLKFAESIKIPQEHRKSNFHSEGNKYLISNFTIEERKHKENDNNSDCSVDGKDESCSEEWNANESYEDSVFDKENLSRTSINNPNTSALQLKTPK
jgi:hypothetical protein